ncbi:hypothetical protein OROHE_007106 [Orobanche hederae]
MQKLLILHSFDQSNPNISLQHLPILQLRIVRLAISSFPMMSSSLSTLCTPLCPLPPKLIPFISRKIVISGLKSKAELKKDPRISFPFFICASEEMRLLSGVLYNLMVDLLLYGDGNPFDFYWSVLDELRNEKLFISPDAFVVLILEVEKGRTGCGNVCQDEGL